MARYTRYVTLAIPATQLYQQLAKTLELCNLHVVHTSEDYMMANENPGGVPFTQLVTVEVLVDNTRATETVTHLSFVVKNEELPLRANNHCSQMFQKVSEAISSNPNWELLKSVAGLDTN
jgi:hypothetical protein